MPFGLKNGPSHYQENIDLVLASFLDKFCKVFIDDICVYSQRKDHCEKLDQVFQRIDECGGQLNPRKCFLARSSIKIPGHIISEMG